MKIKGLWDSYDEIGNKRFRQIKRIARLYHNNLEVLKNCRNYAGIEPMWDIEIYLRIIYLKKYY